MEVWHSLLGMDAGTSTDILTTYHAKKPGPMPSMQSQVTAAPSPDGWQKMAHSRNDTCAA
jgi:hypothetical protein